MRGRTVELVMVTGLLLAGVQTYGGCGSLYDDLYAPLTESGGGGTGGAGAGAGPTTGVGGCPNAFQCDDGNECTIDKCVAAACIHENDPSHVPAQDKGDCRTRVCEDGNVVEKIDDADLPIGDPCMIYTCTSGVPGSALKGEGAVCDDEHGSGTCNNGVCRHGVGTPCDEQSDCYSSACVDGVCCNNACTITCVSCDQPGAAGKCQFLPGGVDDPDASISCSGVNTCTSMGCSAKKKNGETCMLASECGSGSCAPVMAGSPAGVCKLSNGSSCADDEECCSGSCVTSECEDATPSSYDVVCDGNPNTNPPSP